MLKHLRCTERPLSFALESFSARVCSYANASCQLRPRMPQWKDEAPTTNEEFFDLHRDLNSCHVKPGQRPPAEPPDQPKASIALTSTSELARSASASE
jgi:hypothetical protein